MVQTAVDSLLGEGVDAMLVPQGGLLHHHTGIMSALQRARTTWWVWGSFPFDCS